MQLGLRTLAVAVRALSGCEYDDIAAELDAARQHEQRQKQVSRAFDSIESQMVLLGATGVEDELQEQVQETLESLKAAGIKVKSFK